MNRGLIVFAREPVPGTVKTRLAASIGAPAASELYAAMLADVLERAVSLADVRVLVFWAQEGEILPRYPDYPQLEMFRQSGTTLGERMANAFSTALASGIRNCCIIGSDSPDLPVENICQAFGILERDQADVVFGPAGDGGYYLLGMKRLWERLFEDIAWSTAQVLAGSCRRAAELNLRAILLPVWHDIDTIDDLRRLAASSGGDAPRTRKVLRTLEHLLPPVTMEGFA
jgi:uncharacterized protein